MNASARYQPEIDGLRAVAIAPVVLFHVGLPGLRGGFVGVDVFFVISGFLISRLLLNELHATGKIDFLGFYARRVRRLFPALATVVAAVLVLGTFILSAAIERQALSDSAIATMAFVSNIYFWRAQAIYFAPPTDWIPLLNMWTLSVEEQFYLLWPALLALAALLAKKSGWRMPAIVALTLGTIFAASFALFWWGAEAKPTATFYLAPTRGWEFSLGAALALAESHLRRMGNVAGPAGLIGLVLIAISVTMPPRALPWSIALAAFGTAAVIAGVTAAPASATARLLGLKPFVIVGKLSYSWYLWHWPLLAFGRVLDAGHINPARDLLVALGALALAAATFSLIEDPIRRRRPWPFAGARQTLAAASAISLVVAAAAFALEVQADAVMRHDPWLAAIGAAERGKVTAPPGCQYAQTFERLLPAQQCTVGSANVPPSILLWGDSQANQLADLLHFDGDRRGYAAVTWAMSGCPPIMRARGGRGRFESACARFNQAIVATLPELVQAGGTGIILASRQFGIPSAQAPPEAKPAWLESIGEILSTARRLHMRVLVVAPFPVFRLALPQCLAHASPARCGSSRATLEKFRAPVLAALATAIAGDDNVRIWDPFDLFCDTQVCTPVRNGLIMYSDRGHLSVEGSRALAPIAAPQLDWLLRRD